MSKIVNYSPHFMGIFFLRKRHHYLITVFLGVIFCSKANMGFGTAIAKALELQTLIMPTHKLLVLRLLFMLSDFILLNICFFVGFHLSNEYIAEPNMSFFQDNILIVNTIWFLCTVLFGLYNEYTIYTLKDIYRATWRSILLHAVVFQLFVVFTFNGNFPKYIILAFYFLFVVFFLISRLTSKGLEKILKFDFNGRKTNILAIASIGGHWVELLRLMPLFKENNVTFISNKANLKDSVKGHKFHIVPDANKDEKFNLVKCTASVVWYVLLTRPQVIISTGAAPGLLGILTGKILGIKTIWIDSIANVDKLSLSGSIATRIADRVYTQWDHLSTHRVVFSGNIL